ncbi:Arginine biosynthesis bifunctional protein ArgJ [Yarrowia sp. B02]|nr:Arginine biosynthesis bifunctional protein ArgJ [Yarrowia sp. B02]
MQVRHFSSCRIVQAGKERFVPSSGTYPKGFKVGGFFAGVKKNAFNMDLAMLSSDKPCNAAAVFTTNVFKAAPVQVDRKILEVTQGKGIKTVVVNSGCANAVTGEGGIHDAQQMVKKADEVFGSEGDLPASLVMSTGVIGQRLKIDKILKGIEEHAPAMKDNHEAWLNTARGICTTDTFPKLMSQQFKIGDNTYTIAGLTKGAGMIHPRMATLLGFFATDAPVSASALGVALKHAADRSFNAISVDGDTSTNDTIVCLANGAAGGPEITESSASFPVFQDILTDFSSRLSQLVVRDGEGATKFVKISVNDAVSEQEAAKVAETVACSPLVKTALYGKDANWGRILCAVGYSGMQVEPTKTTVSFMPTDGSAELKLLVNGEPEQVDEARASEILEHEDLEIQINLGTGGGKNANFWTCDFSHEYVTINGDYRT